MFGYHAVHTHSEIVLSEPAYTTGVLDHGQLPALSANPPDAIDDCPKRLTILAGAGKSVVVCCDNSYTMVYSRFSS
jgi:hypothetical protein